VIRRGDKLRRVVIERHGAQLADGPRERARRVADRHADPPLSNVEANDTHGIILSPFSDMTPRTISCVMVIALGTGLAAQTVDRGGTEAEARRVDDRIRALQNEAEALAGQARTLIGDLRKLEIDRGLQIERVRQAEASIAERQTAIADTTQHLTSLEEQRVAQLPDLRTQLVDVYKRGRAGYARLLFGGGGAREFARATRAVAALMGINRQRIAEHRQTLETVQLERERLDAEISALRASEAEARQARAAADRAFAARSALIAEIDARRDLNAQFAGELQIAYRQLQQQMADLGAGRPAEAVAVPLAPFRGALDWPVAGTMAVRFGQPSGRRDDSTVKNGVEIAALEGTAVHAIHSGTVSFAAPFAGFGNLVIIDHGADAYSLYGYLEGVSVTRGDMVDSGTEIARVGAAPAGPAALYLEIRIDGRSVDPVEWLKPR